MYLGDAKVDTVVDMSDSSGASDTSVPREDLAARKLVVPVRRSELGAAAGTAADLIRTVPLVGSSTMSVRDAASAMTERGVDYLIVPVRGRYGVLTDATIRAQVVAAGRSFDTPVGELVDSEAYVVGPQTSATQVLTSILEHDYTVVPIVDDDGAVLGVVLPSDFIEAPAGASMSLQQQISSSISVDELVLRAQRVPYLAADLVRRDQPAHEVTAVLSLMHDAVVRRGLEFVLAGHPDLDPDALTWLSLGSNARREPVLSSDIDSAVAFADHVTDDEIVRYRAAFGELDEILRAAGMTIDTNGAVASMPLFARTHAQWRAAAQVWRESPLENKGMIFISLLLDARPIWGDAGLSAVGEVFADLRSHGRTLSLMLSESLSTKARLRSMRDVLTGRGGEFDIKTHAIGPLTNLARWAALSVGSAELDTRSRLRAAAGSPMLPEDQATTLIEVFEVLQRVRLTSQVAEFDRGEPVGDVLTMKRLSPLDRSLVAQAVHEVAGIQRRMANMTAYIPVNDGSGDG